MFSAPVLIRSLSVHGGITTVINFNSIEEDNSRMVEETGEPGENH